MRGQTQHNNNLMSLFSVDFFCSTFFLLVLFTYTVFYFFLFLWHRYVALTYDHRLVDGKEAVLFLRKVKEGIEDPLWMIMG